MELQELIALAAFVLIYLVGTAGARNKRRATTASRPPGPPPFNEREGGYTSPSERWEKAPSPSADADGGPAAPARRRSFGERAAEGLLPKELWEEIERLARGEPPAATASGSEVDADQALLDVTPTAARPLPARVSREASERSASYRTPRPLPVPRADASLARASRAETDRIETRPGVTRAEPPQAPAAPAGVTPDPSESVFHLLRAHGARGLRNAFILQEVIGPPLAMRTRRELDGHEPPIDLHNRAT